MSFHSAAAAHSQVIANPAFSTQFNPIVFQTTTPAAREASRIASSSRADMWQHYTYLNQLTGPPSPPPLLTPVFMNTKILSSKGLHWGDIAFIKKSSPQSSVASKIAVFMAVLGFLLICGAILCNGFQGPAVMSNILGALGGGACFSSLALGLYDAIQHRKV